MSIGIENETALRDSRLHPFFDLIQPTPIIMIIIMINSGGLYLGLSEISKAQSHFPFPLGPKVRNKKNF